MKNIPQKVNFMSSLTTLGILSDKILDNSSVKNKEITKLAESNGKKKAIFYSE